MVPEVYWISDVEPLRLAVMPRPRGGDWLADEVSGWKRLGIDVVVSLLHRYEADELDIVDEESLCRTHGIRYRSFPIQDRGTPESVPEFLALVDEIAKSLKEGLAVAVHCRAGIGRSGLLAATILLELGIPVSDVFAVVSKARGLTVPDTSGQIDWLHSVHRDVKPLSEPQLIRPAHASEACLLSELALRSKAHWGYSSEFLEAVRAELSYDEKQLRSEHMRVFVLEHAKRVVGFYALAHQSGTAIELDALFVEPDCIGKGFGRLLLDHAKSMATTMGATKLIIQGDPNAERFYLAAGAVLTGNEESGSIPGRYLPMFSIDLR